MPCWVPEEQVFLYPRPGATHAFGPGLSTGLACGRSGDPVLMRGLQEVIERDAGIGAWCGRYRQEEWDIDAVLRMLDPGIPGRMLRPNLTYRCYRVD